MTNLLNSIAEHWWNWQFAMLWQTAALIGIIWIIDLCIRKWAHPQVRYALWMLVLVKLLIPPTWTSPASVTSHIPDVAIRAATVIERVNNSPLAKGEYPERGRGLITPTSYKNVIAAEQSDTVVDETQTAMKSPINHPGLTATPPSKGGELYTSREDVIASLERLHWQVYAMLTWLAGIIILSTWLIVRLSSLRREHQIALPLPRGSTPKGGGGVLLPEQFYQQLEGVAAKLNLKRTPQVILTDKVACPAVFGIFRPVLLMPAEKFKSMSRKDTEHILLHELAHIKRGDLLVHAVWMLVQILYWFNPLLWMVRRPIQNLRELCCDATVARLLREKTCHYRETLLETARQLLAEPVDPGLGLLGLFENNNWLVTRLQWLEKNTWKNRPLRIATIIALVAIMTTCVLPMANRQKPEASSQKSRFIRVLDDGATVELLGLCEHPSEGKQWWRADGTPFIPDFHTQPKGRVVSKGKPYEIAVKIDGPDDLSFTWRQVKDAMGSSSLHVLDKEEKYLSNIKASRFNIDKKLKSTHIELGIAADKWTTRFTHSGHGTMSSSRQKHGIAFSKAYQMDNDIEMTVSDDYFDADYRLIAVDKDNQIHMAGSKNSNSAAGKVRQSTFTFKNLNLGDIKEFRYETRPYKWIEFEDVTLRPEEDGRFKVTSMVSDAKEGRPVIRWSMAAVKESLIKEIQKGGQHVKTDSKNYTCYKFSNSLAKDFFNTLINNPNQSVIFKTKGLWLLEPTGKHRRASAHTDTDNLKNGPFVGYAVGGAGPYKFNYEKNNYQLDIEHEAVNCLLNSGSTLNGSIFYKGDLTVGQALVFVGKMPEANNIKPYHLVIYLAGYANEEKSTNSVLMAKSSTSVSSPQDSGKQTILDGPVAYWKFDETAGNIAYDSAGDNNAIVRGANWHKGIFGGGLRFDGIDDYVSCGSDNLDLTEFTWLLWIKRDEQWYSNERSLISTNQVNQHTKGSYSLQIDEGGNWQNRIQFVRHGDSYSAVMWTNKTVDDTNWHHIAATRNNKGEAVLYIDGQKQAQGHIQTRTAFKELNIGAGDKEYSNFNGLIDEVAIYNRALSEDEINDVYDSVKNTSLRLGGKTEVETGQATGNSQKAEENYRIRVAGKLLNKCNGNGLRDATIHFVGAPDDNAKTYPDGSFATNADRGRFHQTYFWLDDKAFHGNRYFGIRMDNHIDEQLASDLQIHIDPENLPMGRSLTDEDGDGIFCDGINCEICDSQKIPLTEKPMQTVTFHKNMPLTDAFRMLSEMYKVNIIPSDAIIRSRTPVPVTNLYDVTFEDILKAICGTIHTYEIKDNFIYVYTNEEYAMMPKEITMEMAKKAIPAFFAEKHKSISKFTPLEWGELKARDDGTKAIRCKCKLTSYNGEVEIVDGMFFFDKTGKVIEFIHLQEPVKTGLHYPGGKTDAKLWDNAFSNATEVIQKKENWPRDSVAVSKAFWKARVDKDYEALKILWPGSASWSHSGKGWKQICQEDAVCDYVFGPPSQDGYRVPYAAREYFDKNGSYNLTMLLGSIDTKNGKRFYVISGN